MTGSFVEPGNFGPCQIRVLEGQFTTDNNQWPLNLDPALVVFDNRAPLRYATMAMGIKDANYLTINLYRIRDPDKPKERGVHTLRYGGFARPCNTSQEKRRT